MFNSTYDEQDGCPSRYGWFEAPDLSGKPSRRRMYHNDYKERKEVVDKLDTRLLVQPKIRCRTESTFPFDSLTLTSIELINSREVSCQRMTLKDSGLTFAQHRRLQKRLTFLYNEQVARYKAETLYMAAFAPVNDHVPQTSGTRQDNHTCKCSPIMWSHLLQTCSSLGDFCTYCHLGDHAELTVHLPFRTIAYVYEHSTQTLMLRCTGLKGNAPAEYPSNSERVYHELAEYADKFAHLSGFQLIYLPDGIQFVEQEENPDGFRDLIPQMESMQPFVVPAYDCIMPPKKWYQYKKKLIRRGAAWHRIDHNVELLIYHLDGHVWRVSYDMSNHRFEEKALSEMEPQGMLDKILGGLSEKGLKISMTPNVDTLLSKLQTIDIDKANKVIDHTDTAVLEFTDLVQTVKEALPGFVGKLFDSVLFFIFGAITMYRVRDNLTTVACVAGMMVSHLHIPSTSVYTFAKLVAHLIKPAPKPEGNIPQTKDMESSEIHELLAKLNKEKSTDVTKLNPFPVVDLVQALGALVSVILLAIGFTCKNRQDDGKISSTKVMKDMTSWFHLANSGYTFSQNVAKMCKLAYAEIYYRITGDELIQEEDRVIVGRMKEFMMEANSLLRDDVLKKMTSDLSIYFVIKELHNTGLVLLKEMQESGLPKRTTTPFMTVFGLVHKLFDEASTLYSTDKKTVLPTWVYMMGDSNVGKSNVTMFLVAYLLQKRNRKFSDDDIYERKVVNDQKFWDAYRNNFCVSIDDLFQHDDKDIKARQAVELIYMANGFQFPLNQAELHSKGHVYFSSPLIISSTNFLSLGNAANLGLCSLKAFSRRRDFVVYVDLDPEIKKVGTLINEVDPILMKEKYGVFRAPDGRECDIHPKAWRFFLCSPLVDSTAGALDQARRGVPLDFFQFARLVDERMNSNSDSRKNVGKFLKGGFAFELLPESPPPIPRTVPDKPLPPPPLPRDFDDPVLTSIPTMEGGLKPPISPFVSNNSKEWKNLIDQMEQTTESTNTGSWDELVEESKIHDGDDNSAQGFFKWFAPTPVYDVNPNVPLDVELDNKAGELDAWTRDHNYQNFRRKWNEWIDTNHISVQAFAHEVFSPNPREYVLTCVLRSAGFSDVDIKACFDADIYAPNDIHRRPIVKNPDLKDLAEEYCHKYSPTVLPKARLFCIQNEKVGRPLFQLGKHWGAFQKGLNRGGLRDVSVAEMTGLFINKVNKQFPALKWVLLGGTLVAAVAILYRMFKNDPSEAQGMNISGDPSTKKYQKRMVRLKRKQEELAKKVIDPTINVGQTANTNDGYIVTCDDDVLPIYDKYQDRDFQGVEVMHNRVIPNLARVEVRSPRFCFQQNLFFVKGRQGLTSAHFVPKFVREDPQATITVIYHNRTRVTANISAVKFKFWPDCDLVTIGFPTRFALMQDLTKKHFMEEHKLPHILDAKIITLTPSIIKGNDLVTPSYPVIQTASKFSMSDYTVTSANEKYLTLNGFHAKGLISNTGDCGAPYMCFDKQFPKKIFGIHTAFSYTEGAGGVFLSRERVEANLFTDDVLSLAREEQSLNRVFVGPDDFPQFAQIKHLMPIGTVKHGSVFNSKSMISPSMLQIKKLMLNPVWTGPAVLVWSERGDPVHNALVKWDREPIEPMPEVELVIKEVCDSLVYDWQTYKGVVPDVCTINEALNTIPGSLVKPIELTTSAGFTLNHTPHSLPGKKSFVKVLDDPNVVQTDKVLYEPIPLLRDLVLRRISLARNLLVANTIWQDSLKDERLELEKVATCGTRMFETGDFDNTIACRMFFMRFVDHIMQNRHRLPCKVGINPDGQEWGRFFRWLREPTGVKFIAGDFKKFDMSIPKWLISPVVDAIILWLEKADCKVQRLFYKTFLNEDKLYYSQEDKNRIRLALMEEIGQATRVNGKLVFRTLQGVPSGHFLTAIFNSIINEVIIKTCIYMVCRYSNRKITKHDINIHFRIATYGDDHIVGVSDSFQKIFNQRILQRMIKIIFGMDYTDSTKNLEVAEWTELSKLTFLQRGFREEESLVFAPLKSEIVEEMVNWVRIGELTNDEATRSNLETALREWFHHGESKFEEMKVKYNDICFKLDYEPLDLQYATLFQEWINK